MSEHPKGYCPVFGNYPKEYNRAVHGPFYPWVNYRGTNDTHFSEVKLGEFKEWFARRNKTPQAALATISRYAWRWHVTWYETRFGSPTKGLLQLAFGFSLASMFACYGYLKMHRQHKYHW